MHNVEINIIGILVSALVVVLLAWCILYILYHYKRRQHHFMKEVEMLRLQYEKELLQAELEVQEQTFRHISLELHDNVGHYISLAKLHLVTLAPGAPDFTEKLESSVTLLGTSLQEIRNLCSNMNTGNLRSNGLIKTVEQQVQLLERSGKFSVELQVSGATVYMDEKKELILFRIFQEALSNIIKHAQATRVSVVLTYEASAMKLRVSDNGCGFDPEAYLQQPQGRVSGLHNIVNRSHIIQATHRIESRTGEGTTLTITTPY